MDAAKTFSQLTASLREMTARLRQEDKANIKKSWETLGTVEHRALLLSLRQPGLTKEQCRGLVFAAMDLVTGDNNDDYHEAVLTKAEELIPQLEQDEFRDKIAILAGQAKQFDKISEIAGALLRGV